MNKEMEKYLREEHERILRKQRDEIKQLRGEIALLTDQIDRLSSAMREPEDRPR